MLKCYVKNVSEVWNICFISLDQQIIWIVWNWHMYAYIFI